MSPRHHILVVEDDDNLRLALADNLEQEGYRVRTAARLAEAEALLAERTPDLVVLDLMLPDGDGYGFCRRLRSRGLGSAVLMLTARSLEDDLVRGFDAGADDYLVKPYRLRELLARTTALLRRRHGPRVEIHQFGDFRLDRDARTLDGPDGRVDSLTRTEFDLLAYLLDHAGRALPRHEILDAVWGREVVVDPHTVDNFVSSLRKKLGWSHRSSFRFAAVRGIGYRFEIDRRE